ncbi:hypothetical protein [Nitrospirillum sp. BR 11828]|uniref:hypothetical protein n=1 Tax=Nitrospirillum sp. BR 11828 TaxID=3104325 RepID=UPI002ACAF7AB|nr:hypothetical protein [Nitrospirillum sp. BR 11828]MDZ5648962.1 hypothetical protein [Nitrospirillum sp. BR 11828]
MPALAAVARALTEGDVVRAHIALLHARLPPLPERAVVVRKNENGLAKQIASNYLTQPRIPAGAQDAKPGTWTSIGAGGTAALDAALAVARTMAGRATLVGAILIPGNIGQTRSGQVPGTDVDYGYAEGQLTLTVKDGDGHTRLIYDGSGDLNGQYRTPEGVLLPQAGPDGLAMAPGAIAALAGGDRVFSQKTKTPNEGEPGTWAINPGQSAQDGQTGSPADRIKNGKKSPAASQRNQAGANSATPPGPENDDGKEKPNRVTNPKHHQNSVSPEPKNAGELYENSIPDDKGVRWAKDNDGIIHRFSASRNGETHWNGSTGGTDPIKARDIPIEIRRLLEPKAGK